MQLQFTFRLKKKQLWQISFIFQVNAVFIELTDSLIVVFVNVAWQIIQWARKKIVCWGFKRWYFVKT